MTIRVRQWKKGKRVGFEVDIRFTYPDGVPQRQRIKAPVESRSAARRWGEARERELLLRPSPVLRAPQPQDQPKEVPTLSEFGPRFIEGYARANKQKASGVHAKERILENHLYPALGDKGLDAIGDEDVQTVKAKLSHRSAKTINNVLLVLSRLLRIAVRWKVIDRMPCTIDLLKTAKPTPAFYEFDHYERLAEAASQVDLKTRVVVLLGGDAGLRRGEMLGLRWSDVDFHRRQLLVTLGVWEGKDPKGSSPGRRRFTDVPKGGRGRVVPMTDALFDALRRHRHLRGELVLYADDGRPATSYQLRIWLAAAQRRAGLRATGGLHVLRHTFCSHLAMRGAPVKAIQELAGHADLGTTLRYMHLSPAARQGAIALLNERRPRSEEIFGEMLETTPEAPPNPYFSRRNGG
jgi:integrase